MPNASDILWFKQQFGNTIVPALRGTGFDLELITAIACQETGYIWSALRKAGLSTERILELCVGDTLDADKGRRAFPQTKDDLIAAENGPAMFKIAHEALVDVSQYVKSLQGVAKNPDKFCHGFGIFQYDLQFFKEEADYFLNKKYADFDTCLKKAISELSQAKKRAKLDGKATLTDPEMACVAIAYNTGRYDPSKGLKQGYFNGEKYYGEQVLEFITLSRSVAWPGTAAPSPAPSPAPASGTSGGGHYKVDTQSQTLNLRRTPEIPAADAGSNLIGALPRGELVRAVTGEPQNGFLEVETTGAGPALRGFAAAKYLTPA